MKISLNWLREFVDYDGTPAALADVLTMAGVEVEGIDERGLHLEKVVVAQIVSYEQHPNADRLSVCRVDDGSGAGPRQIVCGAKNFMAGDKVPLALPGATLPGDVRIKVGTLRGVESEGMLCSARELRLAQDGEGLLILSPQAPAGMPMAELFPADTILDVEITPNRSDLLSHLGLAREVAALTGKPLKNPFEATEIPQGGEPVSHLPLLIAANAREACPFYSTRHIKDIQVGPSPEWLRMRLEAVGLRSINNVVDITNFVMLELGQPLHAYDAEHIGAVGLGVRFGGAGEELLALDGRTYKLEGHHLVIASIGGAAGGTALGLAGLMGGEESSVTAATRSIILESAFFTAAGIRRTSRELGLSSDASYRFERGVDPDMVLAASRRAEDLLLQICGGQSHGLAQTHGVPGHDGRAGRGELADTPVPLRLSRCRQLLGVPIAAERVGEILSALGLEELALDDPQPGEMEWHVPSYRADLRREIDLIEEVARVYGLDLVPGRVEGKFAPSSPVDAAYDFQMKLRRELVGLGFSETRSVSLVRQEPGAGGTPLKNPLGAETATLRGTLLPGLLATAERNARLGTTDLRLFEIGRVFSANTPAGTGEPWMAGLLLTGETFPASWRHGARGHAADLHDLAGVIERLAAPAAVELRPIPTPPDSAGTLALLAEVWIAGRKAGDIGQLAPGRVKALELRGNVLVAELQISVLQALATREQRFASLARFPSVTRDLAVVVDRAVAHGSLSTALLRAGESLLSSVELFDVFTDDAGEKVGADKKSLAYSLTYRADDRTLKTEEVNAAHARLKGVLQAGFGGLEFRE